TGVGILDNISIYELIEDESTAWSSATGGSVVELHAYAIDVDYVESDVRQELLDGFFQLYPEYRGAKILEERMLIRRDCPAFSPGSDALRPTVDTPHRGIKLAGDFIKLPMPSALMERATASGFLAANQLLGDLGVRPEPIETVPLRGILARPRLRRRA
ncbi:MAG: FAD-dependent oxidoreductase, partial [Deltaproteobacteria bacterium]|nr:FAD-dependent oxidoreductase [Deltaproteobacteria bacterium]